MLYILQNSKTTKTTPNNYLIISDSLSSITGIQNTTHPSDISKLIHDKTIEARDMGIDICYVWVPGHCGIQGNEKADLEASNTATSNHTPIFNTYTYDDKKKQIIQILNHQWHKQWTKQNTKLNQIKNNIQPWHNPEFKRKDETIINRLRIGHTFTTHNYLMSNKNPPICETFKHVEWTTLSSTWSLNAKYMKT